MATHVLVIPDFIPHTDNQLAGAWGKRLRLKRGDADRVKAAMIEQGVPRAAGPRRVTVDVTSSGRRRAVDPSNVLKSLLDSLVTCGLLLGDDGSLCVLGTPTVKRGAETVTVITLTDLPEEMP